MWVMQHSKKAITYIYKKPFKVVNIKPCLIPFLSSPPLLLKEHSNNFASSASRVALLYQEYIMKEYMTATKPQLVNFFQPNLFLISSKHVLSNLHHHLYETSLSNNASLMMDHWVHIYKSCPDLHSLKGFSCHFNKADQYICFLNQPGLVCFKLDAQGNIRDWKHASENALHIK